MKNIFLSLLCFCSCIGVYGQVLQPYTPLFPTVYGSHNNRLKADSAQHIPHKNFLLTNTNDTTPQLFAVEKQLWMFANSEFIPIIGGGDITGGDTSVTVREFITNNVGTFYTRTDQTNENGITGPNTGETDYIPDSAGIPILLGREILHVVRNNIAETRLKDFFFNSSNGAITFSQFVHVGEDFQVIYKTSFDSSNIDSTGNEDTTGTGGGGSGGGIDTSTFPTRFAADFLGTDISQDQKITLLTNPNTGFGLKYMRTSIRMDEWNGTDKFMDRIMASSADSIMILLNINWKSVGRTGNGDKVPAQFLQPSEYSRYTTILNQILTKYQSKIEVAIIENEPTTKSFYYGSVLDYIDELALAIPIVHSYGLKVTDGCVHAGYVQQVMSGHTNSVNSRQVDTIIQHYPDLDLDYTNFHTAIFTSTYNENLVAICNYLRANNGGKPIMSNEWHTENSALTVLPSVVAKMRDAHVQYSAVLDPGSGGGGGESLHIVGQPLINALGNTYKLAVHALP